VTAGELTAAYDERSASSELQRCADDDDQRVSVLEHHVVGPNGTELISPLGGGECPVTERRTTARYI